MCGFVCLFVYTITSERVHKKDDETRGRCIGQISKPSSNWGS